MANESRTDVEVYLKAIRTDRKEYERTSEPWLELWCFHALGIPRSNLIDGYFGATQKILLFGSNFTEGYETKRIEFIARQESILINDTR